jgi:hypothetical protein
MTQVPRKYLLKALFTGQTLSVNYATLRALVELAAAESGFGGIKKRHAKLEGLAGEGRISSLGSPQH